MRDYQLFYKLFLIPNWGSYPELGHTTIKGGNLPPLMVVGAIPSVGAHANIKQITIFLKYFEKLVTKEIQTDIDFVTRKDEDLWWYDGEIITTRSKNTARILRLMRENPSITYAELTSSLGINTSAVQKLVKRMVDNGYIARHENGAWRVIATSVV